MLYYIKGNITEIDEKFVVIETNELGYKVVSLAKDKFELLENYKVFIYDHISSDNEPVLYGFLDLNDLKLFKLLIKITGIGAKTAHTILNNTGADVLIPLIDNKDIDSLRKISGIGSKANMVYFELKNKLKDFHVGILKYENVYSALVQMNYNSLEVRSALNSIDENLSDEDALKAALIKITNERQQHI